MQTYGRPWNTVALDDLLRPFLEPRVPVFLLMNARDYADIRKFGRDELDIETQADMFKIGIMARFKEVEIRVSRLEDPGQMTVLSFCGLRLQTLKEGGPIQSLPGMAEPARTEPLKRQDIAALNDCNTVLGAL